MTESDWDMFFTSLGKMVDLLDGSKREKMVRVNHEATLRGLSDDDLWRFISWFEDSIVESY